MTEGDELQAEAAIGHEALKFRESEIGRYLLAVSKQDEDDAKKQLLEINVWKYTILGDLQTAIAAIQDRVRRYQLIEQYLDEAIAAGIQANQQLNHEED